MKKNKKDLLMQKPLLSAKTLEGLTYVAGQKNWQEILIFWLAQTARTMIEDFNFVLNNKQNYLVIASTSPQNVQNIFVAALNELEQNIKEAIEDTRRVFHSENDAINHIIKEKSIPAALVKAMLGGKWPKHAFNFDAVDNFRIQNGKLVPYDGNDPAPGPDFKLYCDQVDYDPLR